jgi:hypothetical protein
MAGAGGAGREVPTFWSPGEGLAWPASLVFMLSSFMGWYSASIAGITYSIIGWHTGTLGKLVFFAGLAVLALLSLRAAGVGLPPTFPLGMVISGLGAAGTIFVLIRLISIPDRLEPVGRAVGIWISLAAGALLIVAGLLKAADEI